MEALLQSVAQLNDATLRVFVQRCVTNGSLQIDAASAELHRLHFEKVLEQRPLRSSASFLTVVQLPHTVAPPSFLLPSSVLRLECASSTLAQSLKATPLWKTWCEAAGIRLSPEALASSDIQRSVYRVAADIPGNRWCLQSSADVSRFLRLGQIALSQSAKGLAWRIGFGLSSAKALILKRMMEQLMESPREVPDWELEAVSQIPGAGRLRAVLRFWWWQEEGAFTLSVEVRPKNETAWYHRVRLERHVRFFSVEFEDNDCDGTASSSGLDCDICADGEANGEFWLEAEVNESGCLRLSETLSTVISALSNGAQMRFFLVQLPRRGLSGGAGGT